MKAYLLPDFEQWDDFDRLARNLAVLLGWKVERKIEGPDARSWMFGRNGFHVWLVFDDLMGMALKCEGDACHLPLVAGELLASFGLNRGSQ